MKVHVTKNYVRQRLMDPGKCDPSSFRLTPLKGGKGKKKVTCCLKRFFDKKTGQCMVGADGKSRLKVQAILTPRKKGKKSKK